MCGLWNSEGAGWNRKLETLKMRLNKQDGGQILVRVQESRQKHLYLVPLQTGGIELLGRGAIQSEAFKKF